MPPGGRGMGGPMGGQFLTEEEKANQPKVTPELLKRVFSYLQPYGKQLVLVFLCIGASSFLTLLPTVLTGKILDEGILKKDLRTLIYYIVLSLIVTFVASLIGVAETYINTWIAQHITFDMRNQMYAHLQNMSQRFFTTNNQGDIITRMTSDIDGVKSVITNTFSSILSNSITLIIAMIAMFQKNWILALVGIIIVPVFTLPTRKAGKKRWTLTNESQQVNDEVNGILNECQMHDVCCTVSSGSDIHGIDGKNIRPRRLITFHDKFIMSSICLNLLDLAVVFAVYLQNYFLKSPSILAGFITSEENTKGRSDNSGN